MPKGSGLLIGINVTYSGVFIGILIKVFIFLIIVPISAGAVYNGRTVENFSKPNYLASNAVLSEYLNGKMFEPVIRIESLDRPNYIGTSTHIGDGLILTAEHVVNDINEVSGRMKLFDSNGSLISEVHLSEFEIIRSEKIFLKNVGASQRHETIKIGYPEAVVLVPKSYKLQELISKISSITLAKPVVENQRVVGQDFFVAGFGSTSPIGSGGNNEKDLFVGRASDLRVPDDVWEEHKIDVVLTTSTDYKTKNTIITNDSRYYGSARGGDSGGPLVELVENMKSGKFELLQIGVLSTGGENKKSSSEFILSNTYTSASTTEFKAMIDSARKLIEIISKKTRSVKQKKISCKTLLGG